MNVAMTRKQADIKYCSYKDLVGSKNSLHKLQLVAKLQFSLNLQSPIQSYSLIWVLSNASEVTSPTYSQSWAIFPKDMSHFSVICEEKKEEYGIWKK